MVDISKIRPGDKVTVEMTFIGDKNGGFCCQSQTGGWRYVMEKRDIVGHTPATREIKVGDRVTWGGGTVSCLVLGRHGEDFWIERAVGWTMVVTASDVADLRHADEPQP